MLSNLGSNSVNMQENNRSAILSILMDCETHTRAEISERMGLTQAAISKIVAELIDSKLIEETGIVAGKKGRRSLGLAINQEFCKVLGVKITRHHFKLCVKTWTGKTIEGSEMRVNVSGGLVKILEQMKNVIPGMLEKYDNIRAIGVAVIGLYSRSTGTVSLFSEAFTNLEKVNISEELEAAFGLPTIVNHDTAAGAFAEWKAADFDKTSSVLLHIIADNGIGAGIIIRGTPYNGHMFDNGKIGHMSIDMNGPKCACGNRGCLENYTSTSAFAKWVGTDLKKHPESSLSGEEITAENIFKQMEDGDEFCRQEVQKLGFYLGCGIASLVNIFNPSHVVITGAIASGGEVLLGSIKETIKERAFLPMYDNPNVYLSSIGEDSVLLGAAMFASEHLIRNPRLILSL